MTDGPSVRASYLPIEHLDAELLASPLWSMVAFEHALTALDGSLQHAGTKALWREAERSLLSRFPGTSMDELVARRDRLWFPGGVTKSVPLIDALSHATRDILHTGGKIAWPCERKARAQCEFEAPTPAARLRQLWRWLTFALPPDLLLALENCDADRPATLSPNLGVVLTERGFAEPHLHVTAAVPFDVLWSTVQFELAQSPTREDIFRSPGAEFDEGELLGPWILRAAICRPVLAAFLQSRRCTGGFAAYWSSVKPRLQGVFGAQTTHRLSTVLTELHQGRFAARSPAFAMLRSDFADMSGYWRGPDRMMRFHQLRMLDPVSQWFPPSAGQSPDYRFTRSAFAYLRNGSAADTLFARLFWQVVRLRVAFYRHVVQRPMTPGLQWFVRAFGRLKPGNGRIRVEALLHALAEDGGLGLRSLEIRTQPASDLHRLSEYVWHVHETVKILNQRASSARSQTTHGASPSPAIPANPSSLEVGIIFHFARSRGRKKQDGAPAAWGTHSHTSPDKTSNPYGYRYSSYYLEQRPRAAALASLLTTFPRTLELVRGVDLCSDERAVPLWAVCGLIEHVKQAADRAAKHLPESSPAAKRPLRVTVHAGEDFVHLLSGIRRVGEAIDFIPLGEGDRIGHAVALGVGPNAWARLAQAVPVAIEERLMDLTWLWRLAMRTSSTSELKAWIPWIREQLDILAHRIFRGSPSLSPAALDEFQCALHNTMCLRTAGFPAGPRPDPSMPGCLGLVIRWLTDLALFNRAQELIYIDVRAEASLTLAAQRQVRLDVGRLGIVVEVNPSSNLLIGNLGTLEDHPLWRLRPPRGGNEQMPPVRICIGSDDPITFATNLQNEYQLVFDAMTQSGMSADECDAWIDDVRKAGLHNRFTIRCSHDNLLLPFTLERSPLRL
jgi:hypothetical protein